MGYVAGIREKIILIQNFSQKNLREEITYRHELIGDNYIKKDLK
jgi:hypothetical protein